MSNIDINKQQGLINRINELIISDDTWLSIKEFFDTNKLANIYFLNAHREARDDSYSSIVTTALRLMIEDIQYLREELKDFKEQTDSDNVNKLIFENTELKKENNKIKVILSTINKISYLDNVNVESKQ